MTITEHGERGDEMKIIVYKKPTVPQACMFAWKHVEYSKYRCKFGGFCKLETKENCNRLLDVNEQEVKE